MRGARGHGHMPESGMPDSTPAPIQAAAPAAAKAPGESRTVALYRAALGPVNTERTLKVFAQFDTAGHTRTVWHPAAAFFTLSWMLFRRLWTEALVYAAVMAGVIGAGLVAWPHIQTWPVGVRGGLLGTLLLLSLVLPGLLGFAWLHRRIQQRVLRAVTAASTMSEACAALGRQAGSRRRFYALALANAVLAVGLLVGPVPCRSTACLGELRALLVPAGESPAPTTPAPGAVLAPVQAVAPTKATPVAVVPVASLAVAHTATLPPPEAVPAPLRAVSVTPEPQASTAPPAPAAEPPPLQKAPVAQAAYGINVGLFADEGNARRAHERLKQAGLPATAQVVATPQGARTRVRVGPFAQRAAADEAAQRIRALGLEAVVFRP